MTFGRKLRRQMQRIRAAAKKRRKVLFEPLEPRILLSSDPLSYTAAANTAVDLTLRLQEVGGIDTLQLINNSDQSVLQSQDLADTSAVEITGSDLDDRLRLISTSTTSRTPFLLLLLGALAMTRSEDQMAITPGISPGLTPEGLTTSSSSPT